MRIVDILMAVPNLLLGISIVAALGNSITVLVFAIALGNIAAFARVTRSSVITVRDTEYVEAARATGASDGRIMWKYVLPNALAPIIVQVTTSLAGSILNISGLSFVGLGVPAPTPEWGPCFPMPAPSCVIIHFRCLSWGCYYADGICV